jgi:hypothetical protein
MSDIDDGRGNVLEAFAKAEPREQNLASLPVATSPLPERIIGAQHVAIPRDEKKILDRLKVLASAAGSDWYYRFPVKSKSGATDYIEGASIKLANDLARIYGNCEIETRVTDLGDSWLIYARFTDYETGFAMTRPFQQRKSQRGMRATDERALDIAFQIGASKAIRNVVVNSLQTFADFAFEEARNAFVDKIGKNLEAYRERTLEGLANKQIDVTRTERVIGRVAKDWTAPDVARVIAMMRSIADGMTTIDETFPPLNAGESVATSPAPEGGGTASAADPPHGISGIRPADPDEEVAAYARGQTDRRKGTAKRAMPGEYRNKSKLAIAWTRGWDDGAMP